MFNIDVEEITWGSADAAARNRPCGPPGRWRRARLDGRDHRSRDRRCRAQRQAGNRLLPADRQLPGKDLCRGQDPGRLLQARRPSDRARDADLPPDRPPDPPALRGRLPQRDAGDRHRALLRSRERHRHPGAGRIFGRAHPVGHSLHGSDRCRPRRLHQRRICAEPHRSNSRSSPNSTSWSPARRTRC